MQNTDLTLFLNQITMGMVNNEAMSKWLANEEPVQRGNEPVWQPEAMDYWMKKLIMDQAGVIANA